MERKLLLFLVLLLSSTIGLLAQPGNTISYQDSFGSLTMTYDNEENNRNAYRSTNAGTNDVRVSWSGSRWEMRMPNNGSLLLFFSNYDVGPNPPDRATGNWQIADSETLFVFSGSGTQTVMLDFTASFGVLCENTSIQTGLSGGTPAGGTYSGPGITDDGNGMTFSFNPAAAGAGTQTISYGDNSNSATTSIIVIPTDDVTFTAPGPFNVNTGLQILSGGSPAGGIYSGPGVIDNLDGTYSFNTALGVGTYTVTYTYTDFNACSASADASIEVVDQQGAALDFDGVNDRVLVPHQGLFDDLTDFTISTWVKLDDINQTQQVLLIRNNVFGGDHISMFANDAQIGNAAPRVIVRSTSGIHIFSAEEPLSVDEWHHLAFTVDAATSIASFYVDGALAQTISGVNVQGVWSSVNLIYLGYNNFDTVGGYFSGQMDEFHILDNSRNCYEVLQLADCELSADDPNLVLYYQFNQDIANSANTTLDATVGSDGTMENFALMGMSSDFVEEGAVVTGTNCDPVLSPEPRVTGMDFTTIPNGDDTPATDDGTDFGDVTVGMTQTNTFEISSIGDASFTIDTIISSNPAFSFESVIDDLELPPGVATFLNITFTPEAGGVQSSVITVVTDDCAVGDYTFTVQGNGVECIAPVINGINIIDCGSEFFDVTLEVDGALNGAASWEWTFGTNENTACDQLSAAFTGSTFQANFAEPTWTYYVRAEGGCLDEPVCFPYVPSELLGSPNEGGSITLADGTSDITLCLDGDEPNELNFTAAGNSGDNFTYLITDGFNNVEAFNNTGVFDFETLGPGDYRIWGLSYSGNLLLEVGGNPTSDPVSDQCYDLSDNFVSVDSEIANAGAIGIINGETENDVCVGDGIADSYSFLFQGSQGSGSFFSGYALTDENNGILQFPVFSPFDFETLPEGNYRVRTILYTGNFALVLGDDITTTPISDDCYDFSDNFIAFNLSALPTVTFMAPGPFSPDAGIQPLTGGMPEGGSYSGDGVIDNGDGTYSFDPSIGLGTYSVSYTYTNENGCDASASDDIVVEMMLLPPDNECGGSNDINALFGQAPNEPQVSGLWDNTGYNTTGDPENGFECFVDGPELNNTIWFTFEGDGNTYLIRTVQCDATNYIDGGDTQAAIYAGDCEGLTPVACNDDEDVNNEVYNIAIELETEAGTTYSMLMDGYEGADGEFCIEVTRLEEMVDSTNVTFQVDASNLVDDGTISTDGIFLAGSFNGFTGQPMVEGADNIWTLTLTLAAGSVHTYKFQNGPGGWETIDTSLGEDCTVGGYGDRQVEVGDMDFTTDLVCFAYCVTCNVVDVDEAILEGSISVFPNPAMDILNVKIDLPQAANNLNIRLMNALGQVVSNQYFGQLQTENVTLNLSDMPSGVYLLQVSDGSAQFAQPLVIQR